MSDGLPVVYVARHGNTAWTHTGQHTGLSDLPLTPDGERNAVRLGERLKGMKFAQIFTSPLQRAARTCELSGFGARSITDQNLVEWDYGKYEGLTSAEILKQCSRARPKCRRGRIALFQRTFHSGVDRSLVGAWSRSWWQVLPVEPSKPKRS